MTKYRFNQQVNILPAFKTNKAVLIIKNTLPFNTCARGVLQCINIRGQLRFVDKLWIISFLRGITM